MAKVLGRVTIIINGTPKESLPGATLKIGGLNATPINTDQLTTHDIEEYVHATITATFVLTSTADVEAVRNLRDAKVTFEGNNGVSYTVTSARSNTSGDWEIGKEGIPVQIFGNAAQPS